MRWICWVSVLLAAYGLASSTASGAGTICTDCGLFRGHCQSACAGPFFGTVPGCCQCQPHCCDNAWAGYYGHRRNGQVEPGTGGLKGGDLHQYLLAFPVYFCG